MREKSKLIDDLNRILSFLFDRIVIELFAFMHQLTYPFVVAFCLKVK